MTVLGPAESFKTMNQPDRNAFQNVLFTYYYRALEVSDRKIY